MSMKLPLQCEAEYFPEFLSEEESRELFEHLCADFDVTNRMTAMADGTPFEMETGRVIFLDEELTGFDKLPESWGARHVWSPLMRALKEKVEAVAKREFQVCPCLYYRDGRDGAAFHSDLPAYGDTTWIASVSLGEEREFVMRSKDDPEDIYSMVLGNGSLLIMGEGSQERYEHAVPHDAKYVNPRINLTFRKFGWD